MISKNAIWGGSGFVVVGFVLGASTTSLMRTDSAEGFNTASLFFSHHCTFVIERNA
jgi:hypothetical protein